MAGATQEGLKLIRINIGFTESKDRFKNRLYFGQTIEEWVSVITLLKNAGVNGIHAHIFNRLENNQEVDLFVSMMRSTVAILGMSN